MAVENLGDFYTRHVSHWWWTLYDPWCTTGWSWTKYPTDAPHMSIAQSAHPTCSRRRLPGKTTTPTTTPQKNGPRASSHAKKGMRPENHFKRMVVNEVNKVEAYPTLELHHAPRERRHLTQCAESELSPHVCQWHRHCCKLHAGRSQAQDAIEPRQPRENVPKRTQMPKVQSRSPWVVLKQGQPSTIRMGSPSSTRHRSLTLKRTDSITDSFQPIIKHDQAEKARRGSCSGRSSNTPEVGKALAFSLDAHGTEGDAWKVTWWLKHTLEETRWTSVHR